MSTRFTLTVDEAIAALADGDILPVVIPGDEVDVGDDYPRAEIIALLKLAPEIRISWQWWQSDGYGMYLDLAGGERLMIPTRVRFDPPPVSPPRIA